MICLYDGYLENECILTLEAAGSIHKAMRDEIGKDEDAMELYEELLGKAIEYSTIRSKWTVMTVEEKLDSDPGRTMKHDSLIVKFNQLAKYLRLQGKPALWRDELGYEKDDKMNRKKIGDMGCYIAFIHAINAR